MNYIFLDVDGVLNSDEFFREHLNENINVDETRVKLVADFVKKTNARIILSSSWRILFDDKMQTARRKGEELIKVFSKYHIEIYDRTKVCISSYGYYDAGERFNEINDYICKNLTPIDKFVIFDDEDFGGTLKKFGPRFIQTNWFERGINEKCIEKAFKYLGGDN